MLVSQETLTRKAWLKALLDRIEIDEKEVRMIGSTEVLHAAIAAASVGQDVRSSVPKWRTRHDSNV